MSKTNRLQNANPAQLTTTQNLIYNMHHICITTEMNMAVLTIHAEDYLADAVREYADRFGKSVNLAAKELLSSALGLVKPPCKRHDFTEFCGVLKTGEAAKMRDAIAGFDTIDRSFWK